MSIHMDSSVTSKEINSQSLSADCENCFGLCCVALPFAASVDFTFDKEVGIPCHNLQSDFRCGVHKDLRKQGFKGCTVFECFGAGQKVSQTIFSGQDWREVPETAKEMYEVFQIVHQLHEMQWYLTEALSIQSASTLHKQISKQLDKIEELTKLDSSSIFKLDIIAHRFEVNNLLLQTSELVRNEAQKQFENSIKHSKKIKRGADLIGANLKGFDLRGSNLRGAYLISTDLRDADLRMADLIGADLRDADLRGANLTGSIFLTQPQVNAAKGNSKTRLPKNLTRPFHWTNYLK